MTSPTLLRRALGGVLAVALLVSLRAAGAPAAQWPPVQDEVKLGSQIAKDIESHYRLVTNPTQIEQITRVSDALTKVVERQDLTYHFKIIDVPVANALSLPGGWVYITAGMMKFVRSDNELAAVLAHELTHVNHHHYYVRAERAKHLNPAILIAAALSVLARSPGPLIGVELAAQGAMSDYQRDLEQEADLGGVAYLAATHYSPVAMLTLMEHLADAERYSGQPTDLGIYQDHPVTVDRVAYIRADLLRRGIPIVRRPSEGYLRITLDPDPPAEKQPVTIRVDGDPILTVAPAVEGRSSAERAQGIVAQLDAFFNRDPAPFDVRAVNVADHWSVTGGERVLFEATPQDAALAHMAPDALAQDVRFRLARVIAAAPYNRKF